MQIGCDHPGRVDIVIGAAADYDFSGIKGDFSNAAFDLAGFPGVAGEEKSQVVLGRRPNWAGLPFQRLLVFVSGGYNCNPVLAEINFREADSGRPPSLRSPDYFLGTGYEYGIG